MRRIAEGVWVVDDFFPAATRLLEAYQQHFAEPERNGAGHRIWDYWYVPDQYTYLRADPGRVLPAAGVDAFLAHLGAWAASNLGMSVLGSPILSLYVNGCGQGWHNDAGNGSYGWVWSLTADAARFDGGETQLLRTEPYWGTARASREGAGPAFVHAVEPRFNRLVVFDDRIVHAVAPVVGTMDPRAGRVVLHGHLGAGPPVFRGLDPGTEADAVAALEAALAGVVDRGGGVVGTVGFAIRADADGRVADVRVLSAAISPSTSSSPLPTSLVSDVVAALGAARLPRSAAGVEGIVAAVLGQSRLGQSSDPTKSAST